MSESNSHVAPSGDDNQTASTPNNGEGDVVVVAVDGSKQSELAFECMCSVYLQVFVEYISIICC
jgi:hypothetical protein